MTLFILQDWKIRLFEISDANPMKTDVLFSLHFLVLKEKSYLPFVISETHFNILYNLTK